MKTFIILNRAIWMVTFASIGLVFSVQADIGLPSQAIKAPPTIIYQAAKGQSLAETMTQIAQRSGITFKLNTDLSQEIVQENIAANNWDYAISRLLVNYNFTTIQNNNSIKTVIITGHRHDGAQSGNTAIISPQANGLPAKYFGFPAGSVIPIKMPVNDLMALNNNETIKLKLPMGQFNVMHDNTINQTDGSRTWVGHLADQGQGYRVFISQGAAGIMGIITTPDGTYTVEQVNGTIYLINTSQLNHAGFNGDQVANITQEMQEAIASKTAQYSSNQTTTHTLSTPIVDLMVVYTTTKQTADYAKQRISFLVTVSNQAYVDSQMNMKLRLVHTEPTAYAENNSNAQALFDLANDKLNFAGMSQKRRQYGADLVFLFRPLYAKTAGSCGTTYVEMADGNAPEVWLGYGTIGDGNSVDELTGYYCGGNTFTHEIGHSLGLVHDREYSPDGYGATPYSYAWGIEELFATIMSYKQPVLMYFSTPLLATQCNGLPCGYPDTDLARSSDQTKVVNATAPVIAGFMPETVAVPILQ